MGFSYNTWSTSWGTSWAVSWGTGSTPPPIVVKRDQGAGAGRKKKRPHEDESKKRYYEALSQHTVPQADEAPKPEAVPSPQKRRVHFSPALKPQKFSDVAEIKAELQKLQFDITQEISLQSEEEEAIFMLMMMAA